MNDFDLSHSCTTCLHGDCSVETEQEEFTNTDGVIFVFKCGAAKTPNKVRKISNANKSFLCSAWESAVENPAELTAEEFARRMLKGDAICGLTFLKGKTLDDLSTHLRQLYLDEATRYLKPGVKWSDLPNCVFKLRRDGVCDGKCEFCRL